MPRSRIAALNVYPVKSCAGFSQDRVRVATRGLVATTPSGSAGDREWMIVDRDGRFVSQREYPRLALIRTSLEGGMLVLCDAGPRAARGVRSRHSNGATREVVVWNSHVPAHDAGDVAAAWLVARFSAPTFASSASIRRIDVCRNPDLRRRLGRAHGVRGRVSAAGRSRNPRSPNSTAARGRRLTCVADEPFPAEHRARGPRPVRRGPHRHARRRRCRREARQAVHALPDHDHRPGHGRSRRGAPCHACAASA